MKLAQPQVIGEETSVGQRPFEVEATDHEGVDSTDHAVVATATGDPRAVPEEPSATPAPRRPASSRRKRRTVSAPAAVGSTAGEAIEILRATGLNPAIELEQTTDGEELGLVLAQEPDGGEPLARGATVALWVGAPPLADDADTEPTEPADDTPAEEDEVDDVVDPWFEPPATPPRSPAETALVEVSVDADAPEAALHDVATPGDAMQGTVAADRRSARRVRLALVALAAGLLLVVLAPHIFGHHPSSSADLHTPTRPRHRPSPSPVAVHPSPSEIRSTRSLHHGPVRPHRGGRIPPPRRGGPDSRPHRRPRHRRRRVAQASGSAVRSTPTVPSGTPAATRPTVPEAPAAAPSNPPPAASDPPPASGSTSDNSAVEREFGTP